MHTESSEDAFLKGIEWHLSMHTHTHAHKHTYRLPLSFIKGVRADARSVSCLRHRAVFLLPLGISLRAPLHRVSHRKGCSEMQIHQAVWRQHLQNNRKH